MASFIVAPANPPAAATGLNALRRIRARAPGTSCQCWSRMASPPRMYSKAMKGTTRSMTLEIRWSPPKMVAKQVMPRKAAA